MQVAETAGYLPGLAPDAVEWQTLAFGRGGAALEVAVPVLTEPQLAELAGRVRGAARARLRPLPVERVAEIVDAAVARLLDRSDPWRRKAEALLPLVTGYDAEMVRLGLTQYLRTFRRPELQKFLVEDFGNPLLLDSFQPLAKGGFARAWGPELLVHVWAGNVPGLPLWSLISGLLVKAGTIGKVSSAEPLFAGWFAQLVAEIEPAIADCLAIVWWKGGDAAREDALLKEADVVLAYGGNDSLAAIRARVPVTARFLPHGHKISFGMVSRAALDTRKAWSVAHGAAHDVIRYDQQGCYSPHLFFVERGGKVSPREFAGYLAGELAAFARRYPRRDLSIEEAGSIAAWRHAEETRALSKPGRCVLGDEAGTWSAVYIDRAEELSPSALDRTVKIVAVDRLADAVALIAPFKPLLQTAGIAAAPEELFALAGLLGEAGVTRIAAIGHMTAPEPGWHHDGRFSLLDLVTLTEIERSAEAAADAFATYID